MLAFAAMLISLPWRWLPAFEVGPIAHETTSVREEQTLPRTPLVPPVEPAPKLAVIADEVVIHAIDQSRTAFQACWRRAQKTDPLLEASKITVHVEVESGAVTAVTTNAANQQLGACLTMVARGMHFQAERAAADFPLFFE